MYTPLSGLTVLDRKRALVSEAVSLLVRASRLIDTPARWTRGHWALDARGREVPLTSQQAARFCLLAAVYRAEHELHGTEFALGEAGSVAFDPDWPPRLTLVVQALSNDCRHDLSQRFSIEFAVLSKARDDQPAVRWHELPAVYNDASFLRHRDIERALHSVLAILLFLQNSDEALRRYLRLREQRQG